MVKCPPPCGQSDSEANASTAGESKEEAAADEQSEGEAGTESPSEGESSGSSESSAPSESESTDSEGTGEKEPDFSEIERPTQSDTVETLPGSAKDNEDHIKGEDKADNTEELSEPAAPSESEDKDSTETPAEGGDKDATETPAEGDKDTETEPEEPAEDDTDYSLIYDEKTGHFKITFNIKEDAEGDQTIELSKVMETVNANGQKAFNEWFQTRDGAEALMKAELNGEKIHSTFNGIIYTYDPKTKTTHLYMEPSCTTVFDVSYTNGSKHTYVYKNNSFTLATPNLDGKGDSGLTGFDGQELPSDYVRSETELDVSMDANVNGCLESLVDKALSQYTETTTNLYLDKDGNLSVNSQKIRIEKGTPLKQLSNGKYYVEVTLPSGEHYYYGGFAEGANIDHTADGPVLKSTKSSWTSSLVKDNGNSVDSVFSPRIRGSQYNKVAAKPDDVRVSLNKYLKDNNTTIEAEILKYYNEKDGTNYQTVQELTDNNPDAAKDLYKSGTYTGQTIAGSETSDYYDNFYKNILSFNVGSKEDMKDFLKDTEAGNASGHGNWAQDGYQMTIADYMQQTLDENPGAWSKANTYFNQLLKSGMSSDEATWAAFTMATNIDGRQMGNPYQDSAWAWYASMVLKQADGTLDLTKTDKDTGEVIKDSETSFYLWKYETEVDEKTHEETKSTLYYTYVDATTDKDGNEVPGYYGWVKYDPDNNQMTYTITTTNGKLNIDYELLENMVYYLQEAVAPEGYDIDTTVYIICDEEDYEQAVSDYESYGNSAGKDAGVTSDSTSWLGAIEGGKTLKIEFVNSKTVTPDPTPDPEPDPDLVPDPENPDTPVDPANPENPPVQDATPEEPAPETPVTPDTPQNPPVQDATPDAPVLPKTGTSAWLVNVLLAAGFLLTAGGWFFTRKQSNCKH